MITSAKQLLVAKETLKERRPFIDNTSQKSSWALEWKENTQYALSAKSDVAFVDIR